MVFGACLEATTAEVNIVHEPYLCTTRQEHGGELTADNPIEGHICGNVPFLIGATRKVLPMHTRYETHPSSGAPPASASLLSTVDLRCRSRVAQPARAHTMAITSYFSATKSIAARVGLLRLRITHHYKALQDAF